ncbi:MAG TPA: hypothetical protein VII25_07495 [Candidatus Acidoferrum sp.]
MALPAEIPVRYTEEDAGYVSVRPVVKQNFRLHELADMVVRVAGKDAARVQKIFQSGTVIYNGYRYWWEGIPAELGEIETLLLPFPGDDPAIAFAPERATAVLFEIGGGTQRNVVEIQCAEASEKKLFGSTTPWQVILAQAGALPARYEKYSHARKADLFRVSLPYDKAQELLNAMLQNATRGLRNRWSTLRPPAAVTFVCPR